MMKRQRIGERNYIATVQRHNGNVDEYNQPTYQIQADWETIVPSWYCEFREVKGGESFRGRQVTADATYSMFGNFDEVSKVVPSDRINVDGLTLGILDVSDHTGRRMEMVIDAKREG